MQKGMCHCGCGSRTKVASQTDARRGETKGDPRRFIRGHNRLTSGDSPEARFWNYVKRTNTCWLWTGLIETTGYGRFHLPGRRRVGAHRWAHESLVGPIPRGMTIDHLCMERTCVNPAHMEVVTRAENTRRAWVARRAARADQQRDTESEPGLDAPWPGTEGVQA